MSSTAALTTEEAERLASRLEGHGGYRILRRLQPMTRGPAGVGIGTLVGCALDVETTGLDHRDCRIVELAMQRFRLDASGRIVETGRPRTWLEDPGKPLEAEIVRLTKLTDADLAGCTIDDGEATAMLSHSDFVIAHNAGFDRPFVEQRLPRARGRPWVCSLRDFPWGERGFEGRSLGHLLMQMGWFYAPHRAEIDVTALLHLVDHALPGGETVAGALLRRARCDTVLLKAFEAPFAAKTVLKARGWTWDGALRIWCREVPEEFRDDEMHWASHAVYRGEGEPWAEPVTWRDRYGGRAAADAGIR